MPNRRSKPLSSHLNDAGCKQLARGAVGEMLAAAELTARGCVVSTPLHPTSYDLIVDSNNKLSRVQVKSVTEATPEPSRYKGANRLTWRCGIGRTPYGPSRKRVHYGQDEIDFLIIVLTSIKAFYVIPVSALADVGGTVRLYPGERRDGVKRKLEIYRDKWDLLL